jgi:condensin complex subunit 3
MVQTTKTMALANLQTSIPEIFMDAQKANALQRSHAINLRKIQETCCLNSPKQNPPDIDYDGEDKFIKEMLRNINKVLPIKKKEPHAERIVRFIAGFLLYIQERGMMDINIFFGGSFSFSI